MEIKPIKTDADYQASLKEIETLMMVEPGSPEGEKLDVLVTLIEAYEGKHYGFIHIRYRLLRIQFYPKNSNYKSYRSIAILDCFLDNQARR